MEFLVQNHVTFPPGIEPSERERLLAAELARGRELVDTGHIRHIWRVPGAVRNVGVWEAADATELHELLTSLPLFPYLRCEVTALAVHPLRRPGPEAQ